MGKLTLSVNDAVIRRAKRFATRQGTSVSRLVEQYLNALTRPAAGDDEFITPLLKQLREDFKGVKGDVRDYHQYLERKYRRHTRALAGSATAPTDLSTNRRHLRRYGRD